jgi:hypothetical protein
MPKMANFRDFFLAQSSAMANFYLHNGSAIKKRASRMHLDAVLTNLSGNVILYVFYHRFSGQNFGHAKPSWEKLRRCVFRYISTI